MIWADNPAITRWVIAAMSQSLKTVGKPPFSPWFARRLKLAPTPTLINSGMPLNGLIPRLTSSTVTMAAG